jgi:hypothetical protein
MPDLEVATNAGVQAVKEIQELKHLVEEVLELRKAKKQQKVELLAAAKERKAQHDLAVTTQVRHRRMACK